MARAQRNPVIMLAALFLALVIGACLVYPASAQEPRLPSQIPANHVRPALTPMQSLRSTQEVLNPLLNPSNYKTFALTFRLGFDNNNGTSTSFVDAQTTEYIGGYKSVRLGTSAGSSDGSVVWFNYAVGNEPTTAKFSTPLNSRPVLAAALPEDPNSWIASSIWPEASCLSGATATLVWSRSVYNSNWSVAVYVQNTTEYPLVILGSDGYMDQPIGVGVVRQLWGSGTGATFWGMHTNGMASFCGDIFWNSKLPNTPTSSPQYQSR